MKKILFGTLLTAMLCVSSVCSATWFYLGDYIINQNFVNSIKNDEDTVKIIANISPKPTTWRSTYYRLEYNDNVELTRGGEDNSLVYLKVATRLLPMYANNTPATDRYGAIFNALSIVPKGVYGVTSIENGIIDFPPKVQSATVQYHSRNSVFLNVLKRHSAIETICQRFSNEIVGTSD